jgi:hypothetical protein
MTPLLTPLFHGTTPEAAQAIAAHGFDLAKSADGSLWFTSNPEIGEVAASGSGAVIEAFIDESLLKLGGWAEMDWYLTDQLIAMGFDGLRLADGDEVVYQIFNPSRLQGIRVQGAEPQASAHRSAPDGQDRFKA